MKKITFILFFALMSIKAFSQSECFGKWPEWQEVTELKAKVENSQTITSDKKNSLLSEYKNIKQVHDAFYYGTNDYCREFSQLSAQWKLYDQDLANEIADGKQQNADAANFNAQCSGQLNESQYASCLTWKSKVDNWANKIDSWSKRLIAKKQELDNWSDNLEKEGKQLLNVEATNNNNAFIKNAKEALTTVIKAYHLTAKSWINTASISEFSFNGIVLRKFDWDANTQPTSPNLNPSVEDYKIYQTFVVEVKFVNGIVISAKFLKESQDCQAGKSSFLFLREKGLVYLKEQTTSAFGKESVTFTRTIAGHSKLLLKKEVATGEHESPDIYNTISIEVFADKVITHGYASDFPTTYFWIGDELYAKKLQVQPADYFK